MKKFPHVQERDTSNLECQFEHEWKGFLMFKKETQRTTSVNLNTDGKVSFELTWLLDMDVNPVNKFRYFGVDSR